jgi:hypothetical protein
MSEYQNRPTCRVPEVAARPLPANLNPHRRSFVALLRNVWVNGTHLRYCFLEDPPKQVQQNLDAVRRAFQKWQNLGIGITFEEIDNAGDAEIRIGFRDDGSWSYVGRQALKIDDIHEPTMNFGWALTDDYGFDTALHEIGHALGLEHEHQNPNAGIVWNTEAVLEYFSGPPNNWDRASIDRNILSKLDPAGTQGSKWDRNSIMHYQFQAGLIVKPKGFEDQPLIPASGLSPTDVAEIKRLYPALASDPWPVLHPFTAAPVDIAPGQQLTLTIKPGRTRKYKISTFGELDTVMVLFEMIDGVPRYLRGVDDAGTDENARLTERLVRGREYQLRLRLYYANTRGQGAIMMW